MTDDDLMPFGKHKDERIADVPPDYLLWLADQEWLEGTWPSVGEYIEDNRDVLEGERR